MIPNAEKLLGGPVGFAPPILDLMFNYAKMLGCALVCYGLVYKAANILYSVVEVLILVLGDCYVALKFSPANILFGSSFGCDDTFSPANRFIIK